MPRNISFSLTTEQIRNRTKTVTRRLGWKNLNRGEILNACVKCMGLKPGEKIIRLAKIRVTSVRRESLAELKRDIHYGTIEASREGFPNLSGEGFIAMFCGHMKRARPDIEVTRIEFEYVNENEVGKCQS